MSRRFARFGVQIPPARLREIAAGDHAGSDEWADVQFALAVAAMQREARLARLQRGKRRGVHWLIVAGLVLTALTLLAGGAYLFVSVLLLHESPL
jgi:hypothetical protein